MFFFCGVLDGLPILKLVNVYLHVTVFFFQVNYEVPPFWNHPQELGKTKDLDWKP